MNRSAGRARREVRLSTILLLALSEAWSRAAGQEAPLDEQTPVVAVSELGQAPAPTGEEATPSLSVRGNVDWISALVANALREPERGARPWIDQWIERSELRPNLKLDYGSWLQLVVQPRFIVAFDQVHAQDEWHRAGRTFRAEALQLYASWNINDRLSLSYGYQNYQWGPAELLTPSNRLFRVFMFTRDPLFVVRGRNLVRVNLTFGRTFSLVGLAEVLPNGEAPFVPGTAFERQGMIKAELSSEDGGAYVGLTAGAGEHTRPWIGEYGSWAVTDAVMLYFDATHAQGSYALYPRRTASDAISFDAVRRDERRVRTLALAGARYSFAGGSELRGEYVFNDAGYSARERALSHQAAVGAPTDPLTALAVVNPGLDLLGRHAVYGSLRIPELPPSEHLTLQLRYLLSLSDFGGALFANFNYEATDSLVLFVSLLFSHGDAHDELARAVRGSGVLGAVYSM